MKMKQQNKWKNTWMYRVNTLILYCILCTEKLPCICVIASDDVNWSSSNRKKNHIKIEISVIVTWRLRLWFDGGSFIWPLSFIRRDDEPKRLQLRSQQMTNNEPNNERNDILITQKVTAKWRTHTQTRARRELQFAFFSVSFETEMRWQSSTVKCIGRRWLKWKQMIHLNKIKLA